MAGAHRSAGAAVDPARLAEADAAVDRLLPRFGVPVARRVAETPHGRVHLLEAGDGPAVVLVHGGFGGAGNWYRTLGPLARRFRVLAPDRPGYGLSDAALDTLEWLEDLLAALDVRRAALVGHAGGGALALAYARRRPGAVTALALSDVPLALAGPPKPREKRHTALAPALGGRAAQKAGRGCDIFGRAAHRVQIDLQPRHSVP